MIEIQKEGVVGVRAFSWCLEGIIEGEVFEEWCGWSLHKKHKIFLNIVGCPLNSGALLTSYGGLMLDVIR